MDEIEIFVVLPADHGVLPVELAEKERHALVLSCRPAQRRHAEREKILRLDQLRADGLAAIGGIRRIVVLARPLEVHEARIFDSVRLRSSHREYDALTDVLLRAEAQL